jgi:hypothetical protein
MPRLSLEKDSVPFNDFIAATSHEGLWPTTFISTTRPASISTASPGTTSSQILLISPALWKLTFLSMVTSCLLLGSVVARSIEIVVQWIGADAESSAFESPQIV